MDHAFFCELSRLARATIRGALAEGLKTANKDPTGFDPVTEADRSAERALRGLIERTLSRTRHLGRGIWPCARRCGDPLEPGSGRRHAGVGVRPAELGGAGRVARGGAPCRRDDRPAGGRRAADRGRWRDIAQRRGGGDERLRRDGRGALVDHRPLSVRRREAEAVARVRGAAKVARYGLDAMAYARVATGDIDLVIENKLMPHDIDALVAVVRGAGGHFGDWEGGEDFCHGRVIAAATRAALRRSGGAARGVTAAELGNHRVERRARCFEQDQQMIEQVGGLRSPVRPCRLRPPQARFRHPSSPTFCAIRLMPSPNSRAV